MRGYILGISQDLYDSGVTLVDRDGHVLFAVNEERYTRRKNQGGFPIKSLEKTFKYAGVKPSEVEYIAVSGEMTPPLPLRALPNLHRRLCAKRRQSGSSALAALANMVVYHTPISHIRTDSVFNRICRPLLKPAFRRALPDCLKDVPVYFAEHHMAHAASAQILSGFRDSLIITADGMGDGLSLTVNRCDSGKIRRLWVARARDSFGLFFEMLTEAMGFVPSRDEGKLTGLASRGDPDVIEMPDFFRLHSGKLKYLGPRGAEGIRWARERLVCRYRREDIAAWAQRMLERHITELAKIWLVHTGLSRLAVAGGVFANVKLNQRLCELPELDELFVCPNMGDGGLSLGAICATGLIEDSLPGKVGEGSLRVEACGGSLPGRVGEGSLRSGVGNVFWGQEYSVQDMEYALKSAGVSYRRSDCPACDIAKHVANGKIVACFQGATEWGPRALGNRSILARTDDLDLTARLGKLLQRSDFMPFAPAAREEDAERCVINLSKAPLASEFMTVCFECTREMKKAHPAVVHVDGTARLQVVRRKNNRFFHDVLDEYSKITGWGVMLNTSFNMHEEPIVQSPSEAIGTFVRSGLDILALGPFIVS